MAKVTLLILATAVLVTLISGQCTVERARPSFTRSVYEFSSELVMRVARVSENHFAMSPLSLWTLITAISEGADHETLRQIRKALRHHPNKCFNSKYHDIVRSIVASGDATLERSGALVFDSRFPVNESFKSTVSRLGLSEVLTPQFDNFDETANVINGYVSSATHGAIEEVIAPEDLEGKHLIMIDAIYFKGQWRLPFAPAETEESPFYNDAREQSGDVNLMYIHDDFNVVSIDKIQAKVLELPYVGNRFSMLIFLPYTDVPLSHVIEKLGDISLQSIFNLHKERPARTVEVQLPRFKIESSLDSLSELLQDMGLNDMFQTTASFPYISDYELYVSSLIQKASVEVNEEGTEASAVSEAEFASRLLPEQFLVNKPFLFMIVEKTSQAILFTGAYSKPSIY